jgi:hypothetical protein
MEFRGNWGTNSQGKHRKSDKARMKIGVRMSKNDIVRTLIVICIIALLLLISVDLIDLYVDYSISREFGTEIECWWSKYFR